MSLLTRFRAEPPVREGWQPCSRLPQELSGDAADMNDLTQVITSAYRVEFRLDSAPGARIAICTYAADGAAGMSFGAYQRRFRYRYSTLQHWQHVGWERDENGGYLTPASADFGAEHWAVAMAGNPDYAPRMFPDIFAWNGENFPATEIT